MSKKYEPSVEQQAIFDWVQYGSGNAIVEAVAGAGKTTTLVHAMGLMKGNISVVAFNKKMGDELASKTSHLNNCRAGTFHSVGFGALRYYMKQKNVRVEVDGDKVKRIAQVLIHDTAFEEFGPAICQVVSLAKQMGFGVRGLMERPDYQDWVDIVEHHSIEDKLPEWATANDLIPLCGRTLTQSNTDISVIDYDDMIYLPLLLNLRLFKNDWVLIDEAQDTNPTRRELAARMLAPGGRLIAVGDPHQAIFGFTGADADSLDIIRSTFKAATLRMSVTFRCPKAVVRAAQEHVSHIVSHANSPEGEHLRMTDAEMMKFVAPGDAILSRFNRPLVTFCFKLIRANIPAKIEGRNIGEGLAKLATRWKVKSLSALPEKYDAWRDAELKKLSDKREAGRPESGEEAKADKILDQHATLMVLLEKAQEDGITTRGGLKTMIESMFDDVGNSSRLVVLSSVHRSKGLEWDRVFVLDRETTMPPKRPMQDWEMGQEINLIYVALTRAKSTLVDVSMVQQEEEGEKDPL